MKSFSLFILISILYCKMSVEPLADSYVRDFSWKQIQSQIVNERWKFENMYRSSFRKKIKIYSMEWVEENINSEMLVIFRIYLSSIEMVKCGLILSLFWSKRWEPINRQRELKENENHSQITLCAFGNPMGGPSE